MASLPPRDPESREQARRLRRQQVRRRRIAAGIALLLLLALIIILLVLRPGCDDTSSPPSSSPTSTGQTTTTLAATNRAELTGANNVPPVDTQSTGTLSLAVDPAESIISFVLEVNGLTNTSVARIYQGTAGSNGEAIATLFDGPTKPGAFTGVVAQGSISQEDLTGPLAGQGIPELIALIQSGDTYCVVGNTSYPDGAIRGQIE